jgi:hypothetical protein
MTDSKPGPEVAAAEGACIVLGAGPASGDASSTESKDSASSSGSDGARSERNILEWMSYLPDDCVSTMIRMGWDVTT